jgi:hypothetical protein
MPRSRKLGASPETADNLPASSELPPEAADNLRRTKIVTSEAERLARVSSDLPPEAADSLRRTKIVTSEAERLARATKIAGSGLPYPPGRA